MPDDITPRYKCRIATHCAAMAIHKFPMATGTKSFTPLPQFNKQDVELKIFGSFGASKLKGLLGPNMRGCFK